MIKFLAKQIIQHREKIAMKREDKKERLIHCIMSFSSSAIGKTEEEIPNFKRKIREIQNALHDLTSYHTFLYRRENRLIRLTVERALRNICGKNSDSGIFDGYTDQDINPLSRTISVINHH